MKKITHRILLMACLLGSAFITAQTDYGIKAGLSYNSNGDLKEFIGETESIIESKGDGKSGFTVGFYGKLDLGILYVRPEVLYTKTTSEYSLNTKRVDYRLSKIDLPLLIGFKAIGPVDVFVGPAFQYIIKNDIKGVNLGDVSDRTTLGINLGASASLGKLSLDVRYERGLKANEASFIDSQTNHQFTLDSRPSQLIFSVSYSLRED